MIRFTLITALALAASPLSAALPRYEIRHLPPSTLLNNHGLVPIPPELRHPDIDVFDVNDAGEFVARLTEYR